MNFELEVIGFDLASCIVAEKAGAHRIELCANPNEGGTTPSLGMIRMARKSNSIQLFPIIRPRGGDFHYDNMEFLSMIEDIKMCKEEGCDGVVLGMLHKDGTVDVDACHELIHYSGGMDVTFHRAFDRVKNQVQSLEQLIQLGCKRVLTSGGYPTASEGKEELKKLVLKSADRITIMIGSGIKSSNIEELYHFTKAKAFHASARKSFPSQMHYQKDLMKETLNKISIDENEVQLLRKSLDRIFN
jgi:copper homeostasis protein